MGLQYSDKFIQWFMNVNEVDREFAHIGLLIRLGFNQSLFW